MCFEHPVPALSFVFVRRFYSPDFADNAAEVGAALARARAALPEGCPVFLLGESMGAPCVIQHLLSDGVDSSAVDGVILCGALIEINPALLPPKASSTFSTIGSGNRTIWDLKRRSSLFHSTLLGLSPSIPNTTRNP